MSRGLSMLTMIGESGVVPSAGADPLADLVVSVTWSTATGSSNAALQDSGRTRYFNQIGDMGAPAAVAAQSGGFPSTNMLDLAVFSGLMYCEGVSQSYWGALAVGEYITFRFQLIMDSGNYTPMVYISPQTQNYIAPSQLSPNVRYELQVSSRRISGTDYTVEPYIISDPEGARTVVFEPADFVGEVSAATLDTEVVTEGTQAHIDRLGGLVFGIDEDFTGSPTHPVHPDSGLVGGGGFTGSPWSWHFTHSGASGSDYARTGCLSIYKGATSGRTYPLPQWTQAEEDWEPS